MHYSRVSNIEKDVNIRTILQDILVHCYIDVLIYLHTGILIYRCISILA